MKRVLIGCGMLTLCGTIANADPYEVIPFHTKSFALFCGKLLH